MGKNRKLILWTNVDKLCCYAYTDKEAFRVCRKTNRTKGKINPEMMCNGEKKDNNSPKYKASAVEYHRRLGKQGQKKNNVS